MREKAKKNLISVNTLHNSGVYKIRKPKIETIGIDVSSSKSSKTSRKKDKYAAGLREYNQIDHMAAHGPIELRQAHSHGANFSGASENALKSMNNVKGRDGDRTDQDKKE